MDAQHFENLLRALATASRRNLLAGLAIGAPVTMLRMPMGSETHAKQRKHHRKKRRCSRLLRCASGPKGCCPPDVPLCCPERCCPTALSLCCPFACCKNDPNMSCGTTPDAPCVFLV